MTDFQVTNLIAIKNSFGTHKPNVILKDLMKNDDYLEDSIKGLGTY